MRSWPACARNKFLPFDLATVHEFYYLLTCKRIKISVETRSSRITGMSLLLNEVFGFWDRRSVVLPPAALPDDTRCVLVLCGAHTSRGH